MSPTPTPAGPGPPAPPAAAPPVTPRATALPAVASPLARAAPCVARGQARERRTACSPVPGPSRMRTRATDGPRTRSRTGSSTIARVSIDRPCMVREHAGVQRREPCVGEGRAGEHGRRGQRRRPRALRKRGEADGDHQRARPPPPGRRGGRPPAPQAPRAAGAHAPRPAPATIATSAAPARTTPAPEYRHWCSTPGAARSRPRVAPLSPRCRTSCAQTPTWSRSAARRFSPIPETWSSSSTDLKPPCCSR